LRTLWDPFQKIRFTELKDAVQAGEQLSMWIIKIETPIDNYGSATSERRNGARIPFLKEDSEQLPARYSANRNSRRRYATFYDVEELCEGRKCTERPCRSLERTELFLAKVIEGVRFHDWIFNSSIFYDFGNYASLS